MLIARWLSGFSYVFRLSPISSSSGIEKLVFVHGDVAAQRQGPRGRRTEQQRLSRERGTVRSNDWDLERHRQSGRRTPFSHGDVAALGQGARGRGTEQQRLY